jgi:glycosyltransferase involved in cell wall biosynthesis
MQTQTILVVCGAGLVSGKEIMTLNLLRELKHQGYKCACITSSWGTPLFTTMLNEIGVDSYPLRLGFISKTLSWRSIRMSLDQLLRLPALWFGFRKVTKRVKPDVIIHTNFHHLFLLFPRLGKGTHFYWSHEIMGQSGFYRSLFRRFEKKVSRFICVSQAVAASIIPFVGASKTVVITNGIAAAPLVKSPAASETLSIAIIGQVAAHKGHETLLRAMGHSAKWSRAVRLIIVGTGNETFIGQLRQLSIDLGIEGMVEWKGFISSVNAIYEGIGLVVVPSVQPDPYPTTIMESCMRGIPVIGSAIGGIPEMIESNRNGFIFEAGNVDALSQAIQRCLEPGTLQALSEGAVRVAREKFGMEAFRDKFIKLIGDCGS